MFTPIIACAIFLIGWLPGNVSAQEGKSAKETQDTAKQQPVEPTKPEPTTPEPTKPAEGDMAIRTALKNFVEAFNNGDAKAVAAHWTEDGDYIDDAGQVFRGREAIENEYGRFFAEHKGVHMRIVIDSLKLVSDSAAIEDGRAILEPAPRAPEFSKYMAVHVKVGNQWLMSTVRDLRVEVPTSYRNIEDLEWLIGTWTSEEQGAKSVSICRWVANKSFVERSYTVTLPDGTTNSGVQIVGWDPQGEHVQSWNFSADGGHALGIWSPRENGWEAEVRGVLGDGTSTTATNLLTRLDDNAYAWQSINRTVGNVGLPDLDEVVMKRSAESTEITTTLLHE
jgi:uncharacterized protein (TIGR02246 family)